MYGYGAKIIKVDSSGKTNVRIIYIGDTVTYGRLEHIYDVCPVKRFNEGWRVNGNILVGCFKFVIANDNFNFLVESVGRIFFGIKFIYIYVHISYNYYEIVFCDKGL